MPAKYHIHIHPAPPKHQVVGKYGILDWREDCSACRNCVKRECVYSVYEKENDRLRETGEYLDYIYECMGCLCCVQSCTKGLLTQHVNPDYMDLGDEVWTSDIISSTWYQAETGKVPVSGAGYPGPFRGPGFDSMLTDMSEIVRPTRDGIHGREYISTQVDVGRKPMRLDFTPDGEVKGEASPIVEVPLPVIFNLMPWHEPSPAVTKAIADAARELGTYAVSTEAALLNHPGIIPFNVDEPGSALAEWADSPGVMEKIKKAKAKNKSLVAIIKVPLDEKAAARTVELGRQGAEAIHLCADWHGVAASGKHITEAVREVHRALVEANMRDEVTLIAGGGISLAEHVAKTIISGADLVAVDIPLMIALECRVCMNCEQGIQCPIGLSEIDHDYAVQRIMNLMGGWHSQLLEVMGAMGIREVRRLRGEAGRAMLFDDLEKECFGPIFGNKKAEVEVK